jgi:Diacylglycerol kinase catalytic domain
VKRTLLITNANSGSAGAVEDGVVVSALQSAGLEICERLTLPEDDLPTRANVESGAFKVVAILSGDGTISSLCDNLSGWDGEILVLPGGTMNLLSRRLHGELALAELLDAVAASEMAASPIPIICFGEREILTGLTVGPSTSWGEVREGIRQGDVTALADAVPAAWSDTLADTGVWVKGYDRTAYSGIFIEPNDAEMLSVVAFRANNVGDMIGHGIAWLRRDFREGPKDDLGEMAEVTVVGDDADTGLLIDGELEEGRLPLTCSAGMSSVRFLRMTGG